MSATFKVRDGQLLLDRIDLKTDGAVTVATGAVDIGHWPEQTYKVKSKMQFPRMREIFFAHDTFSLHGDGDFQGVFHLFKGGRQLTGDFTSALAGVNDYRFPNLAGSLIWVPDRFEVTHATAAFLGGKTSFRYEMSPLGNPARPARAQFDADYTDVDLTAVTDFYATRGIRLAGLASGHNEMGWPLGKFAERSGHGTMTAASPPGMVPQGPQLAAGANAAARERYTIEGPFSTHTPLTPVGIAAELTYAFDQDAIHMGPSRVSTEDTYVAFEGDTAWGERSRMPFRVTSRNWQESDRLLAGLMTAFGATTNAIPLDGIGRFEGVMLGAFRRPRIEGKFSGAEMRAWDVNWGEVDGDFVVDNAYVNVSRAVVKAASSRMDVSGQFSLGYPRADGGEEIDARVRVDNRVVPDFLAAFDLQDYDVDGMLSGDFHVYGEYTRPFGFGRMAIDRGTAYKEPFSHAEVALRFEGAGVRLDGLEMDKGGGHVTGAAYVGWNGTYSFNADGRGLAVETLEHTTYPGYPTLSGQLDFSATGSGTFDFPRYDAKGSFRDLFIGDEGIGQMTGRLAMRGTLMTYEFEAASSRLAVSGNGRVEMNDEMDAEMSFRVTDTSLDPVHPRLSAAAVVLHLRRRQRDDSRRGRALQPRCLAHRDQRRADRHAPAGLQAAQPGADPVERGPAGVAGRCPQGRRRRHGTRPDRHRRSQGPGACPAGQRRREPRRAAGVPARCAELGARGTLRAHRRHRAGPDCLWQRAPDQRAASHLRLPQRPREHQRHRDVRRDGHPDRRPDGAARRRTGPLRRTHRDVRLSPERVRCDRRGRGSAAAVPGGHALADRRHARAAGARGRPGDQRRGDGQKRELPARHRHLVQPVQRVDGRRGRASPRWPARCPLPDQRCASTCGSWRHRRCGSRTARRGSWRARTSTCAAPSSAP